MRHTCPCGVVHERPDDSTWHGSQCDNCIVSQQYERAVQKFDETMAIGLAPRHVTEYLAANVQAWKTEMIRLGLLAHPSLRR